MILNRCFLTALLLLVCIPVYPATTNSLNPEQILQKELLINKLITDIHLLRMDFLDLDVRERILESMTLIDNRIKALPDTSDDSEARDLLEATRILWPVINRHSEWLVKLPDNSHPPEVTPLLRALGKLDRQLLILRQKMLARQPDLSRKLRFLEQALLMQRMTSEYLALSLTGKNAFTDRSGRKQLRLLASRFEQRFKTIRAEIAGYPHASEPIRQSYAAWSYIANTIIEFPENRVPTLIARYSSQIVNRLASVHNMF